jgi:flagellar protein FlaI
MAGDISEALAFDLGGDDEELSLTDRVRRTLELLRGADLDTRPYRPDDGQLATFELPEGHDEVERYWVNAPYAYVVITHDPEEAEQYYHAVEPELDGFERELLARVVEDIRDPLLFREGAGRAGR